MYHQNKKAKNQEDTLYSESKNKQTGVFLKRYDFIYADT